MSLFKILRGKKEYLKNKDIVDGYAYFTPDDGAFYIDVRKENTEGTRIRINPSTVEYTFDLTVEDWDENGNQTIAIEDFNSDCIGTIGIASSASSSVIQMAAEAELYIVDQSTEGQITLGYKRNKPSSAIPVSIILTQQLKGVKQ